MTRGVDIPDVICPDAAYRTTVATRDAPCDIHAEAFHLYQATSIPVNLATYVEVTNRILSGIAAELAK